MAENESETRGWQAVMLENGSDDGSDGGDVDDEDIDDGDADDEVVDDGDDECKGEEMSQPDDYPVEWHLIPLSNASSLLIV